jgi:hypothetical protein
MFRHAPRKAQLNLCNDMKHAKFNDGDFPPNAFREKPGSQVFAKRSAPLNRGTRSAFNRCRE